MKQILVLIMCMSLVLALHLFFLRTISAAISTTETTMKRTTIRLTTKRTTEATKKPTTVRLTTKRAISKQRLIFIILRFEPVKNTNLETLICSICSFTESTKAAETTKDPTISEAHQIGFVPRFAGTRFIHLQHLHVQ